MLQVILAIAIALFGGAQPQAGAGQPKAVATESRFDFGRVVRGTLVQHDFVVENRGNSPLVITRISMTAPLIVKRLPQISPGQRGDIPISLDTSSIDGPFDGEVILFLNDPVTPEMHFSFAGAVFETVELSPLPAFFVATTRNRPKEQSIEIINHESKPLSILKVEHPTERFATRLDTIEDGRRYRLTILMSGTGPAGKHAERILVHTSSPVQPVIIVPANTWLRERVYTFPDEVDLGALPFQKIKQNPELLDRLTQTLMVYQAGGKAFEIKVHTDLTQITITPERGPQGDRWQLTIRINKGTPPSTINGSIHIETNDPEFKTLTVPVHGVLFGED